MKPIRTEADLDALARAAKALAVVTAWSELGLFDALAHGPRALDELPADRRALAISAPVLKHLGLLVGDDDRVGLSPVAAQLRREGGLPTGRSFELLAAQARMADVIRSGGPLVADDGVEEVTDGGVRIDDPEGTARFLDMLHRRSEGSANACRDWLCPLLPAGGGAVLDVGGGHGRYARAFADAGHRVTLFDFPAVVEYARGRHGDSMGYLGGNFRDPDVDFGGPYDLVFLSNVVHGESDAENRRLVARLVERLRPGGHLVLKDMFIDDHGAGPEIPVFFGLTMLYYTRAGASPSLAQAKDWLRAAGLGSPRVTLADGFQLLRARRSAPPRDQSPASKM